MAEQSETAAAAAVEQKVGKGAPAKNEQGEQDKKESLAQGHHPLECMWTFWFDKKQSKGQGASVSSTASYQENLRRVGSVRTVEEFWSLYSHIMRPAQLPKDSNYHVFRNEAVPMWESFPNGGCWIIKVPREGSKKNNKLGVMWENLVMALVGEVFEEPDVMGIVLSTRPKEDLLSVWNRDNEASPSVRFKIGDKLREILQLDETAVVEYKDNISSMKDRSTFRNAKPYIFAATSAPPHPHPPKQDDH